MLMRLLAVAAVALFLVLGEGYGYVRAAVGMAMFVAIFLFGARWIRSAVESPLEPEVADVSDYGLKYVCTMCGLELKVEVAARDKAPTHCMEPMVLVRSGGRPPLRPVD
ncbi:MAG TPA: hypothetical protein VM784_10610 [Actinomycetota bacterium]|nr:hypothetical protein [Actinomycetota bacterium]